MESETKKRNEGKNYGAKINKKNFSVSEAVAVDVFNVDVFWGVDNVDLAVDFFWVWTMWILRWIFLGVDNVYLAVDVFFYVDNVDLCGSILCEVWNYLNSFFCT